MSPLFASFNYFLAVFCVLVAIVQIRRGASWIYVFATLLTGLAGTAALVVPGYIRDQPLLTRILVTASTVTLVVAGGVCAIIALSLRWKQSPKLERNVCLLLAMISAGITYGTWASIYEELDKAAGIVAAHSAAPSSKDDPLKKEPVDLVGPPLPKDETAGKKPPSLLAQTFRDLLSGKRASAPEPEVTPTATLEEENFRFTPPGKWEVLDAKKVNPIACYAAARYSEHQMVLIICERMQEQYMPDLSVVVGFATSNLKAIGTPKRISQDPFTHQGIQGIRIEHEVTRAFASTTVIHQIMAHRGFAWQIMLSGQTRKVVELRKLADDLLAGFTVLDLKRQAESAPAEEIEPKFTSPLGWSIDLTRMPDPKWDRKWPDLEGFYPHADFGVVNRSGSAYLFARSISLPVETVSIDAIADAFLRQFSLQLDSPAIKKRTADKSGPATGIALHFDRKEEDGSLYHYRGRILQHGRRAWFVCAFASEHNTQALEKLPAALDCFTIADAPSAPADAEKRPSLAAFYNAMALHFDRKGDLDQALRWLKHANVEEHSDPVILNNLLFISSRAGRPQEGLDTYDRLISKFPGNTKLQAEAARLTSQTGQRDRAIERFAELFKGGYRNDDDLASYISLHLTSNEQKAALELFDRYTADKAAPPMRRLRASLLAGNDRRDEAIADLMDLRKQEPQAAITLYRLADFLADAGRHQEIVDQTKEFLGKNPPDADVLHYQGVAQLRLKRPEEAKKSFEAGLAIRANDPELKELLTIASAQLGEGDNSQIKTVVKPVAIPADLLQPPKDDPGEYAAGKNAFYLSAVRAVAIEKENDRILIRTTEHRIAKIVDREGAEAFNTLHFSFKPTAEDFHVNSLIVRDEENTVVGTGRVEDYYVLDESDSGIASNDRTVHAPVPGLRPGCTVEYSFTRLERLTANETPFLRAPLANGLPVLRSSFILRAPSGLVTTEASPGLKSTSKDDALVWTVERPVPFVFEPLMAPWHTFHPFVTVGDPKGSWTKLGHEYLSTIEDRLKAEPALDALVQKLTAGLKTEAEQVRALARYVQNELTYNAIEFGRRARIPQPVSAITRNRYGDCKDHALLLHHLLRTAKISSHLALINSGGNLRPRFPSLDQFNHAIVYVPSGSLFIDCTLKSDAFQASPVDFANYEALVLDPKQPRLTKVSSSGRAKLSIQRELSSKPGADIEFRETVTTMGEFSTNLRDSLRYRDPQGRRAAVLAMLKRAEPTLEFRDFEIENLLESEKPLVLKITASLRRKAQEIGDQLVVHLPAAWEHVYLDTQAVEKRLTPFEVRHPYDIEVSLKVPVPAGWRLARQNPAKKESLKFASFATSEKNAKGVLEREASVSIHAGSHPAANYAKYVADTEALKTVCAPDLTFEKEPATAGSR